MLLRANGLLKWRGIDNVDSLRRSAPMASGMTNVSVMADVVLRHIEKYRLKKNVCATFSVQLVGENTINNKAGKCS